MTDTAELRVLTYNVRSLRDDLDALARVVRRCAPDVMLVQEAPRLLRWRSKRAALARRCGLVVATTDRPGGLCILTALRVDLISTSFALLPRTPRHHQRALVGATVACGGAHWRVMSVHMSTDEAERRGHLEAVESALSHPEDEAPLIVGGDINEDPGGPMFSLLSGRLQDAFGLVGSGHGFTSPSMSPRRRLDAIFAESPIEVRSCEVVDGPDVGEASDHLPVLAVLGRRAR
jgi:endonuclease/exonuclease/phosphatase family metal-dependent hydrolase